MDPRDFFAPANYERPDEFGPMDDLRGMSGPEGPGDILDPRDHEMAGPRGGPGDMIDPRDRDFSGPLGGPASDPLDGPRSRMFDPVRDRDVDFPGPSGPSDLSPSSRSGLLRSDFPRGPPGYGPEPPLSPRPHEGNEFCPRDLYDDEFLGMHREPNLSPSLRGTWTDDGRQIHSMLTEPHPMANAPEGAVDYVDSRRGFSQASMFHSHPSEEVDEEFVRQRDADPMWSPEGSEMRYEHGRLGYRPPGFYDDEEKNPGGRWW